MKKWYGVLPVCFMLFSVNAEENVPDDEYVVEEEYAIEDEGGEYDEMCIPEQERRYSRRYHCPHRYSDFYDYEDKDVDATWPGKIENSFMEELMR